jgi:hypothetical protein
MTSIGPLHPFFSHKDATRYAWSHQGIISYSHTLRPPQEKAPTALSRSTKSNMSTIHCTRSGLLSPRAVMSRAWLDRVCIQPTLGVGSLDPSTNHRKIKVHTFASQLGYLSAHLQAIFGCVSQNVSKYLSFSLLSIIKYKMHLSLSFSDQTLLSAITKTPLKATNWLYRVPFHVIDTELRVQLHGWGAG